MLPFIAGPIPVTVLALLPAVIAWWTGRRLLTKGDDPALPELLLARQQRIIKAGALAVGAMLVLGGSHTAWGIPLLALVVIAAAYPVRRGLLGETWGFARYLWHTMGAVIGGFGFWLALALAPTVVQALGRERWWLALALLPALLAWEHWYPKLWLRAHSARPLARDDLAPRFAEIVRRAGGPPPAVHRVGPPGSRFVNAVALPSVREPAVALGNALLELLAPDEIAGIFAHEVAHFDQFTPRRLRWIQRINRLLIAAAVVLPLAALFRAPAAAVWIGWLWPIVVVFALGRRAATSQRHETESDVRAAELCGDTEAVVRGLVKLHLHARIPRRWPIDFERAATHPSLVRRIQALRAATATSGRDTAGAVPGAEPSGAAVASAAVPTVLVSPREGAVVVLDDSRAYWLEGVAAGTAPELAALCERASSYRAVRYADLVELRVAAEGERRVLRAKARGSAGWSVPLAASDVARAQEALDLIDVQLGQEGAAVPPIPPQLLALIVMLAAMVSGRIGVLLIPIGITLFRPSVASLAALGAMAMGTAVLGSLEPGAWGSGGGVRLAAAGSIGLGTLAFAGLVSMYVAAKRAESESLRGGQALVAWPLAATALAIVATLAWFAAADSGVPIVGSKAFGTLAITVLGLAALLFAVGRPRERRAAYAGVALAAMLGSLGVDRGALFSRPPGLAEGSARASLLAEVDLGRTASGLELSPGGTRFLVRRYPTAARRSASVTVTLGGADGALRDIAAVDAKFLDDDRLLVLVALDTLLELRLEQVDSAGAPLWADTIPGIEEPTLAIGRWGSGAGWSVFGSDVDEMVVLTGTIGERGSLRRLAIPDSIPMMGVPMVFGAGDGAIVPAGSTRLIPGGSSLIGMLLFGLEPMRTELWRVADGRATRAASLRGYPQCGVSEGGAALCAVRHGAYSALWTVSADGAAAEAAPIPMAEASAIAVGPGLRASAVVGGDVLLIDVAARRVTRVALPADSAHATEVSAAAGRIALLRHATNGQSRVAVYRLE